MEIKCNYCNRAIAENEKGTVQLKDDLIICKDCADRTRILYPYRYTKVTGKSDIATFIGNEAFYESTIKGQRTDPLNEMTIDEFKKAVEESKKAADGKAALYGSAKAVIEADHVHRYFINTGTPKAPKYAKRKVYGVMGKVVLGELITGAEVVVSHKDGDFMEETQGGFLLAPVVTVFGQVIYGSFYYQDEVTVHCAGQESKASLEAICKYNDKIPVSAKALKDWTDVDPATQTAENGYPCKLVIQAKGIKINPGDLIVKGGK